MSYDRRRGVSTPFSRRHGHGGLSLNDLNLAYTLDGNVNHINRVAFSSNGDYLSGAGNDGRVSIWSLQGSRAAHTSITNHTSDILSTAFVGNDTLISGGKDSMVEVHQVLPTGELRSTQRLYCHVSAVTFIEPDPSNESVFFTASIDGTIRQYDCRQPNFGCFRYQTGGPNLGSMHKSSNCIIASHNRTEKFHSVKANAVFPYQLVTASSDCVVKLYDRRRLTLLPPQAQANKLDAWVAGYCPLHLLYQPHPTFATFAEFSPRGDSILAAYHADHVYTFDLAKPSLQKPCGELQNDDRALSRPWRCRVNAAMPNPHAVVEIAEELTTQARTMASLGLKVAADGLFSAAVTTAQLAGESGTFSQQASIEGRAALWTARDYPGDREAALRELEKLQALQPQHLALIAKRARGFLELGSCIEAAQLINQLRQYAGNWSLLSPNHTLFEEMAWLQNEIEVLRVELEHTMRTIQHNNNGSVNSSTTNSRTANTRSEFNRGRKRKFIDPFHANDSLPFLADERSRPLAMAAMTADDLLSSVASDANNSSSSSSSQYQQQQEAEMETATSGGTTSMQSKPTQQVHWKYFFAEGSVLLTKEVITQYSQRFIGAANINTLLLESCFLGADGEVIASCSDDGHLFFWDRYSGELLLCRKADAETLLTVRAHPHGKHNGFLALATAGRDHCCRVWSAGKVFGRLTADITAIHPFTPRCGPLELDELQMIRLHSLLQDQNQSCSSNSNNSEQSSSEEMISSSDENNSPRDTKQQQADDMMDEEEAEEAEEEYSTNASDDLMILPPSRRKRRTGSPYNLQDIADTPSENIQPLSMQNLQQMQRQGLLLQIDEGGRRHWNSPNNSRTSASPQPSSQMNQQHQGQTTFSSVNGVRTTSTASTAMQNNSKPANGSSHTSGSNYRGGTTTGENSNTSLHANNSSSAGSGLSSSQTVNRASASGSASAERSTAKGATNIRITSPPDQSNQESSSMTNSLSVSMRSSPTGRPGRLNGLSSASGSDSGTNSDQQNSFAPPGDQILLVLNQFHQELKRALTGHPMQLDEIMAVEQIIAKNQRALREHLDSYN